MPIPEQDMNLTRIPVKQKIYKTLQEWIVKGKMLPGERVNDSELAQFFHVSRTPVREAIQMLAEEKLINVVPSSGTFVSEINMEDMKHVYYLMGKLQGIAVEEFIENMENSQIEILEELNEKFHHAISSKDIEASIEADGNFHRYIAELSGNPYNISFTDQLLIHCIRNEYRCFESGDFPEQSYDFHNRIIKALRDKNLILAKELLEENWMSSLI